MDRVASSNLASSSIKNPKPFGFGFFIYLDRFEESNAARTSAACRRLDGGKTSICAHSRARMQTNLASSSKALDSEPESGVFSCIKRRAAATMDNCSNQLGKLELD